VLGPARLARYEILPLLYCLRLAGSACPPPGRRLDSPPWASSAQGTRPEANTPGMALPTPQAAAAGTMPAGDECGQRAGWSPLDIHNKQTNAFHFSSIFRPLIERSATAHRGPSQGAGSQPFSRRVAVDALGRAMPLACWSLSQPAPKNCLLGLIDQLTPLLDHCLEPAWKRWPSTCCSAPAIESALRGFPCSVAASWSRLKSWCGSWA